MTETRSAVTRVVRATRTVRSLEELAPPDAPQTIIEADPKTGKKPQTIWVKLKADYWTKVPLTPWKNADGAVQKENRAFAGSTIELPYDEAQRIVSQGKAEMGFPPRDEA